MSVMENVVVRRKVAAVDLEMYGELVQTYRATLTASGLAALNYTRVEYRTARRMYSLFSGRDEDDIHFELMAELG